MRNVDRSLPSALFIGLLAFAVQARASSSGISSLVFGSTGCPLCHQGGSTPTVTLTGPTTVAVNTTNEYTLKISVVGSQDKGGLNVAATDGTLAVGGSASSGTKTIAGTNGFDEITHSSPKMSSNGFTTFSFLWTAPSVPTSVDIDGWGNAVVVDSNPLDDAAALASLTVTVEEGSACATTPLPDCRKPVVAGKSTFQLKDNAFDTKDALTWKWNNGAATAPADFGDPVNGSTSYHLCVYDESAGVPAPVMEMTAPAGGTCAGKACWAAKKTGFLYKDKGLMNSGLMQVQLTAGAEGKAKILVKGKGEQLPMPLPGGNGLFVQDTAVIVQLVNSDGLCWEADFSAPATKNDTKQFSDKND